MMPIAWEIDDRTSVHIITENGEPKEIRIIQNEDWITCSMNGASVADVVLALLSAIEAAGWDWPDLSKWEDDQ